MKSTTATLALLIWPLVAVGLFRTLPRIQATLWTFVGAQLLLPVGEVIKIEAIPQFDKASIPSLCAFLACLFSGYRAIERRRVGVAEVLIFLFVFGPVATSLLNGDAIIAGPLVIPGVGIYDSGSAVEASLIALLPFFVGRSLFRSPQDIEQVLKVLAIAGLVYSIPMLFEMRFSPQLHAWIYGYFPSDFIQQVRGDGYRPMVFMGHGLIAATFMFMTVCAATALWRTKALPGLWSSSWVAVYLAIVLALCRSAGAALFGIVIVPLIGFARVRTIAHAAITLALISLFYPMLRFADLIPNAYILETVQSFSADRAASLRVRFENESILLNRAFERPIFGWGRYGRSRVYDEDGRDTSITDGRWVITIGQFGIVGFLAEFGLLVFCVVRAASAYRFVASRAEGIHLVALALLVSANVLDLLPNSSLLPITWLFAGALLGRAESLRNSRRPRFKANKSLGKE